MSWIALTEDDVKTRLSGPELTALKTAALSPGQGNPLPDIITQVVNEVRGYVAGCMQNALGAGATIPTKLVGAALAMIRYRLATRLPVKSLLDDARKSENDAAIHLLEKVADCKFGIDQPTTKTDEAISATKPSMADRDLQFTRRTQDGL